MLSSNPAEYAIFELCCNPRTNCSMMKAAGFIVVHVGLTTKTREVPTRDSLAKISDYALL